MAHANLLFNKFVMQQANHNVYNHVEQSVISMLYFNQHFANIEFSLENSNISENNQKKNSSY